MRPEAGNGDLTDILDAHCLARIARFKRPTRYEFHIELPTNAHGTILKRALRRN